MKKILLLFLVAILSIPVLAQETNVSGTVTDEADGAPLPGVNVVVKGTTNGTVTNSDGKYSLTVPSPSSTLVFSFIGLVTQEVEVAGRQVIDLPMKSDITKNNAQLVAERTKSIEAGIEAEFFEGRVGFDFTWYKSNSFDQAIPVNLTSATGYVARFVNSGEVENKGIEVSAFASPIESDNFSWTLGLTFPRNRNNVVSLYSDAVTNVQLSDVINPLQGSVTTNAAVGHPYGVLKGTNFVFTNGQPTVNSQGRYIATASSAEIIGDPNPDWLGGITNTFNYKNVKLNFLIDIRHGGDIFSLDQWYGEGTGLYPHTAGLNELGVPKRAPVAEGGGILLPGVKQDGTPNDIRASNEDGNGTVYGYPNSPPRAWYVYDGSYVKLREVALTYSLPSTWIEKLHPLIKIAVV